MLFVNIIHTDLSFLIHRVIPHPVYSRGPAGAYLHCVPDTFTTLETIYLLPFVFLYKTLDLLQYHCILPLEANCIILFKITLLAGQVKSLAILTPVIIQLLTTLPLKYLPVFVGCVLITIPFLAATLSPDFVYHMFLLLKVCISFSNYLYGTPS